MSNEQIIYNRNFVPRVRALRACKPCSDSHLSCDNQRPCKRCCFKGIPEQCQDNQPKRRKRSDSAHQSAADSPRLHESSPILVQDANSNSPTERNLVHYSPDEPSSSDISSEIDPLWDLLLGPLEDTPEISSNEIPFCWPGESQKLVNALSKIMLDRGWFGHQEMKAYLTAERNSVIAARALEETFSEEKKQMLSVEKQCLIKSRIISIEQSQVPTILRIREFIFPPTLNVSGGVLLHANEAFRKLTGYEDELNNDGLAFINSFHYPNQTSIHAATWDTYERYPTKKMEPKMVPVYLRMWKKNASLSTLTLFEEEYVAGTLCVCTKTNSAGCVIYVEMSFLPSPEVLIT
ncbi:transcriptional regulator Regulator of drug sensitivity (RDS2) [Planoprotostelium fungivorum]|uniref:Transcriptional regulator Regulator of drug sensitivity (RDS2) n=1 Tax=Planoprotostelium fungivorum TaxID=1890364 RepID=A0A2P6NS20_9EUKA|nr:transcriptional regulator Regulator of drug sensitivity (RDS2) [Planoprotostelium fungivorum]